MSEQRVWLMAIVSITEKAGDEDMLLRVRLIVKPRERIKLLAKPNGSTNCICILQNK